MGNLFVVGIGTGQPHSLTPAAREAIARAQVVVGYDTYIKQLAPLLQDKQVFATGMKRELERCRHALHAANKGADVALVCSGDAGVYGMASPVIELLGGYPNVAVEVVPGVTAALFGAALLGAPLGNDFAVISLSDLLTPWECIEKRLSAAASADFCICLYNPSSKTRSRHLARATTIIERFRSDTTLCGWVRNAGRSGQDVGTLSLGELKEFQADMLTCIFVGNSQTRLECGFMVTPRGYRNMAEEGQCNTSVL